MVLIAEIMEEAPKTEAEGEPEGGEGEPQAREEEQPAEDRPREAEVNTEEPQDVDTTEERLQQQPEVAGDTASAPPLAENPKEAEVPPAPPPGKILYNDYALRVAYIMRNYLYLRQGGGGGAAAVAGGVSGEDRCRAMMEVVRKENGRWLVSKVVLDHTHTLVPPPDPAGAIAGGGLVPMVGMEFDSVSAAKAYYSAYCEKMGFEAKAGSGKRLRGKRILVMQRFLCSKGFNPAADSSKARARRGPYKKKEHKEAGTAAKDGEVMEVIPVEDSAEKSADAGVEGGAEVQSGQPEKGAALMGNNSRTKPPALAVDAGKSSPAAGKDIGKGKDDRKVPLVSNPGQSRLLRELGIRVSKYTHEERRDIILKYMQKRNSRQVVDRSIKIPSRQALAERRQRGAGGKFLSKEETQTLTSQEETTEDEPELPAEVVANAGGVPLVGMVFENEDKAYEYYVRYAASVGFSVRKGWWDRSAKNVTRSRVYVCSREGFRPKNEAKRPRPETRTGCSARMAIKITSSGKYRVSEFLPDHNHQLAAPLDIQMLKPPKLAKVPAGGRHNASQIPVGYKNYLRSKRMKDMRVGDTGAILEYLQKMKADNPSFYYAIQVDECDQMTNIFWADAKSQMDYHYFGDVVCFDSTYKANDYGRPFALFIGVNHHKQTVIFGSAFLYDETVDSFKWLFETFNTAMCGKQPKTILMDQCTAMSDAVATVWPGTIQRLCVWQICQNAAKHLAHVIEGSDTFAHDFSQCMYDFEDEELFLSSWKTMLEKYSLNDNEWLSQLFEEREKWALAYGHQTFCADMESTLRAESFSNLLKEKLDLETDLSQFFKLYEMLVDERRYAELQADYHASQGTPRIPPLRLLWQAANAYTPVVFEMFRREFELFMDCIVYSCGEVGTLSEYQVTVKDKPKGHFVRFDSSDATVICTCRKFEIVGIQCCHVLKVLDLRNIKELPPMYVLKRWRKDAKTESIREINGFTLSNDPSSTLPQRYNSLCRILFKIAARAAENGEAFTLMVNQSDQLLEHVERILQTKLLEKHSFTNASKGQPQNLIESENVHHDNNNEALKVSGRKKNSVGTRRRHQTEQEMNKRQKVQKGQSEEAEMAGREDEPHVTTSGIPPQQRNPPNQFLAPNHFMQGPYVTPHQLGLGTAQGYNPMAHFGQDSSTSTLQQQSFQGVTHLNQGFPTPDMHGLQFVGNNPQLDHQNTDQGQCTIPEWVFL